MHIMLVSLCIVNVLCCNSVIELGNPGTMFCMI